MEGTAVRDLVVGLLKIAAGAVLIFIALMILMALVLLAGAGTAPPGG